MITCVTAPSRSGTSLTMQMLNAAGVPVMWNMLPNRQPWNERGFYEYDWRTGNIAECEGHAVKVMPFHLDVLTPEHEYRFIVILRNAACIEKSMAHTVQWRGSEMSDAHAAADWQQYVLDYVRLKSRVIVGFDELFTGAAQERIGEFMKMTPLQIAKMNDCVDHSMWHFKPEAQ